MSATRNSETVFSRLRASRRAGTRFTPTPASTRRSEDVQVRREELGIYASIDRFATMAGIDQRAIEAMVATGGLTHIRLSAGTIHIHVEKGLRDLERLEHGPEAQPS